MSSDRDWRKWGKSEPSFGVVTCPEFEADRIAGKHRQVLPDRPERRQRAHRANPAAHGDVSTSRT